MAKNANETPHFIERIVERSRSNTNNTRASDIAHHASAHAASCCTCEHIGGKGQTPAFQSFEHRLGAAIDKNTDLMNNFGSVLKKMGNLEA
jgi:hypothetical protein